MNDTSFETPYLKTLNISNNVYDRFVPDQVLTHHNLNKIIDYFEDQDRLSRVHTIGVGIGCGLDFFVETDEQNNTIIKVNSGVGITTDGDLVVVDTSKSGQTAYEFRYFTNPFFNRADYARFDGLNIVEIHTQEGAELLNGEQPLSSFSNLGSHYLLIYVENYNENPGICSGSGCDDTGEHIYANLKFLLTDKEGFDVLTAEDMDSIYYYKKMRSFYDSLPELSVTRPILKTSNTKNQNSIYTLYKSGIESNTIVKQLQDNYIKIIDKLDNRLNVKRFSITPENIEARFDSLINIGNFPILDIQYRYDHLKDLIETYDEIRSLLLHINADCVPNTTAFPKHLLLGAINPDNREFTRHNFYPSHIVDTDDEHLLHVLSLVIRFYNQLDQYQIPASGQFLVNKRINTNAFKNVSIKITPSKDYAHALSNRSIPYYYRGLSNLVKNWNFNDIVNRRATAQLSYHKQQLLNIDSIQSPLKYNHLGYDFYRIEGHLGKSYTGVLSKLTQLKTDFNLAFDIKAISIGDALEQINLSEYSCQFEDLKTLLKAWRDEFECLVKNGYEFFKKYSFKTLGDNATSTSYLDSIRRKKSIAGFRSIKSKALVPHQVESLISEATDYAIQETSSTDPDVLYKVATEYMVREVGGYDNEEEAFVYVDYPTKITTDLYAVGKEFVDDLQIYTKPGGLDKFKAFLNKLCFDLNKAKEDIVTARTNQAFGGKKRDSMYEFMIYDLSKLCCFKSKIEWLLKEMEIRKKKIFDTLTLSNLVKENPGIEHMAGVPKGGTFIIVYGGLDKNSGAYSNKVIADFALPYMCCSDCPPDVVVIKQEVAVLEDLFLEPNIYCIIDGKEIPKGTFTPTPDAGTITSPQGTDFIENNDLFNPNKIPDTLVGLPITFKVNEKEVAETAIVYKLPNTDHFNDPLNLEIIPTINTDNESVNIVIIPKTPYDTKGYLTYSWINDIGVEIDAAATLDTNLPIVDGRIFQNFSLIMGVNDTDASCTTTIEILIDQEINIIPEEVGLELIPDVYCFEEGTTVDVIGFTVTPANGTVTSNQGSVFIESGNLFNPNKVPDTLLGTTLKFKVNAQNVSQTALVYKLPANNHFSNTNNVKIQILGINDGNESANVSITPLTPYDGQGYLLYQWTDEAGNDIGEPGKPTLTIDIPIVNTTITKKLLLFMGVNNASANCDGKYEITIEQPIEILSERTCFTDFETRIRTYPINDDLKKAQEGTANTEFGAKLDIEIIQPAFNLFQEILILTEEDFKDKDTLKTTLDQIAGLLSFLSEAYTLNPDRKEFLPQFLLIHEVLTILFLELTRCCEQTDIIIFTEQIDRFQRVLKGEHAFFKENGIEYAHITQGFFDTYNANSEDLRNVLINIFNFS
ncbi:hypothetical protein [Aquimarina sp. RZ0]|uniref:hypothetical protein n=1 Tax=Aquimarina sp. RZ0 TaxID=2607730 RepID=UPI0011F3DDB6|nr:hypothetical protein [Aquimarina sp. RZ0]KAA1248050.1 hypothetical protein F0000_00195 [Aquimarina sp. RZ0]